MTLKEMLREWLKRKAELAAAEYALKEMARQIRYNPHLKVMWEESGIEDPLLIVDADKSTLFKVQWQAETVLVEEEGIWDVDALAKEGK